MRPLQMEKEGELRGHESMVRCMIPVQMQTGTTIGGLGSALSRSAPVSTVRTSTHVWSADVQGKVVIWDPQRMAVVRELELGRGEAVFSMCQVGRSVWIGTAGHIYCVDLHTFAMFNWRAHERPINDLVHHDGCVWTASNDGTIKVLRARPCFLSLLYLLTPAPRLPDVGSGYHPAGRASHQRVQCAPGFHPVPPQNHSRGPRSDLRWPH